MSAGTAEIYHDLARQLAGLLDGETDIVANAANAAALIWHGLPDLNWAGFYFRRGNDGLVLGPFQGKPACARIAIGAGVCGTAAAQGRSVLVADVHAFPGHIACDPDSRSELVVPLIEDGAVLGVLDLDSPLLGRFGEADRKGCEHLAALLVAHHRPEPVPADDIDPESGCRVPLPRRDELNDESRQAWDRLANPEGGSLRGLKGPGGIQLHSPELARRSRPLNHYLRYESGLGGRVRELAILATAREHDNAFEWAAHEPAALAEGIAPEIIDLVRWHGATTALAERDAIVIDLAREIFNNRRVSPQTYAGALGQFGRRRLVDLVALMGNYAATAALLTAFAMQSDGNQPLLPPRW